MGRNNDHSGVPYTCPLINEVISAVKSVEWPENSYWDATRVIEILEQIRTHNEKLRQFGIDTYIERDEYSYKVDDLEREIDQLKETIEQLKQDVINAEHQYEESYN